MALALLSFGPEGSEASVTKLANPELRQRITGMKHLLNGVAVAGALALAAPVWAQTNPPASAPPAAQSAPAAPAPSAAPPPAAEPAAPAPSAAAPPPAAPPAPATTSAAPPKPMPKKMVMHKKMMMRKRMVMRRPPRRAVAAGDRITEQLNREELARINSGNTSAPPPTKP